MHHPFRVGEVYRNRLGPYEVVSIDAPTMTVRYPDGKIIKGDIATFARIWDNLKAEAAAVKSGVTASTRGQPVRPGDVDTVERTLRPRNKGKQGALFEGLTERDFQASVTGTSWRARDYLGGLLAQRLSDALGEFFQSWAIYRQVRVYIVHAEVSMSNREEGVRRSKFFFALGPEGAHYGLYIERNSGDMDGEWDWPRFVARLHSDAGRIQSVSAAIHEHGITALAYLSEGDDQTRLAGRLVGRSDGLAWLPIEGRAVAMAWPDFAELLSSLDLTLWCDLYFQAEMSKAEAMGLGIGIADRVVKTFVALLPLYTLSRR